MSLNMMGLGIVFTVRDLASHALHNIHAKLHAIKTISPQAAQAVSNLNRTMVGSAIFTGIGMAGKHAMHEMIETTTEFDHVLKEGAQRRRDYGDHIDDIKRKSFEMAQTTGYSALEVAETFKSMAGSAINAKDGIAAMDSIAKAARATGTDLSEMGGATMTMIREWGLTAADSAKVTNMMAAGMDLSGQKVKGMMDGMKMVGPVARAMNQDLGDVLAAQAVLAQGGIKNTQGGSTIRSILSGMMDPKGKEMKAIWAQFEKDGIHRIGADGQIRKFKDVMAQLAEKYQHMDATQRSFFMFHAGRGQATAPGIAQLLGSKNSAEHLAQMSKLFAGGTIKIDGKDFKLEGFTDRAKTIADSQYLVIFKKFDAAMFNLREMIGEGIMKALMPVVQALTWVINKFTSLPQPIHDFIGVVLALGTGLSLLAGFTLAVVSAFAMYRLFATYCAVETAALRGAVMAFAGPALWIAAIAGLIYLAWVTNFGGIRDILTSWYNNFREIYGAVRDLLTTGMTSLDTANHLKKLGLWDLAVSIYLIVTRAQSFIKGFSTGLVDAFTPMWDVANWLGHKLLELVGWLGDVGAKISGATRYAQGSIDTWNNVGYAIGALSAAYVILNGLIIAGKGAYAAYRAFQVFDTAMKLKQAGATWTAVAAQMGLNLAMLAGAAMVFPFVAGIALICVMVKNWDVTVKMLASSWATVVWWIAAAVRGIANLFGNHSADKWADEMGAAAKKAALAANGVDTDPKDSRTTKQKTADSEWMKKELAAHPELRGRPSKIQKQQHPTASNVKNMRASVNVKPDIHVKTGDTTNIFKVDGKDVLRSVVNGAENDVKRNGGAVRVGNDSGMASGGVGL